METRSVNFHVGISSNTSKSRQLEIRGNFHFSCRVSVSIFVVISQKALIERFCKLCYAIRKEVMALLALWFANAHVVVTVSTLHGVVLLPPWARARLLSWSHTTIGSGGHSVEYLIGKFLQSMGVCKIGKL